MNNTDNEWIPLRTGTGYWSQVYHNSQGMVMKVIDSSLFDNSEMTREQAEDLGMEMFQRELAAYEKLKSLQGRELSIFMGANNVNVPRMILEMIDAEPSPADYNSAREALTKIHDLGLKHGDITKSNFKLRPDGTVVVLDFGMSGPLKPLDRSLEHKQLQECFGVAEEIDFASGLQPSL